MDEGNTTLVLGYGNPARGDDGLGPAFIQRLAQLDFKYIETRVDYQLSVEDALDIGNFRKVIFVDAAKNINTPFEYQRLDESTAPNSLDTHAISPKALIYLARTLFNAPTPAYVMAIRGYAFEPFVETLSKKARKNLDLALQHLSARMTK